jgi:hypothetical protein
MGIAPAPAAVAAAVRVLGVPACWGMRAGTHPTRTAAVAHRMGHLPRWQQRSGTCACCRGRALRARTAMAVAHPTATCVRCVNTLHEEIKGLSTILGQGPGLLGCASHRNPSPRGRSRVTGGGWTVSTALYASIMPVTVSAARSNADSSMYCS